MITQLTGKAKLENQKFFDTTIRLEFTQRSIFFRLFCDHFSVIFPLDIIGC